MRPNQVKKPVQKAVRVVRDVKAVLQQDDSRFVEPIKRLGMQSFLCLSAGILFSAVGAALAMRAQRAFRDHREWQRLDRQLDEAIQESCEASDPIARF